MKKICGLMLGVLLAASLVLVSCSDSDEGTSDSNVTTPTTEPVTPSEDDGKSEAELKAEAEDALKEAKDALLADDYDTAVAKFQTAYKKNPSDENKIYYALTELATLSTDKEVADIIKNKLGVTDYPATLNALLSTDWFKEYSEYKTVWGSIFEKKANPEKNSSYIRVSGTLTDTYSAEIVRVGYVLYNDVWIHTDDYESFTGIGANYLTDVTPNPEGIYLIFTNDYNQLLLRKTATEYLYDRNYNYSEGSSNMITKSDVGNLVRVTGTESSSSSENSIRCAYEFTEGRWIYSSSYLADYTLSDEGNYLINIYVYAETLPTDSKEIADCLYEYQYGQETSILGAAVAVPGLTIPEWVTSNDYYKSTLVGTTQTYKTWWYLLYANAVTNHETGFNNTIDSLLSIFHKKSETIKSIVDSLGNGTATLEPALIEHFNLTDLLGEDSVDFGKTEMNVLVSALESIDAVLNFAASYDLSGNLKSAEVGFDKTSEEILNLINDCVTAKTLAVRNAEKLTTSKTLFADALTRLISSYDAILNSTTYPQAAKDTLKEYSLIYDGAKAAKNAIENGTVLYIPKTTEAASYPTTAEDASFGIDFGKIFTAGYFTKLIERTENLENIKFYYVRYESTYSYNASTGYNSKDNKSEPMAIADISTFFTETTKDAGYTYDSGTDENGKNYWKDADVRYKVGIMANQTIITDALPGVDTAIVDDMRFVSLFTIR